MVATIKPPQKIALKPQYGVTLETPMWAVSPLFRVTSKDHRVPANHHIQTNTSAAPRTSIVNRNWVLPTQVAQSFEHRWSVPWRRRFEPHWRFDLALSIKGQPLWFPPSNHPHIYIPVSKPWYGVTLEIAMWVASPLFRVTPKDQIVLADYHIQTGESITPWTGIANRNWVLPRLR